MSGTVCQWVKGALIRAVASTQTLGSYRFQQTRLKYPLNIAGEYDEKKVLLITGGRRVIVFGWMGGIWSGAKS